MIGQHELDSVQFAHLPHTGIAYTEVVEQGHSLIYQIPVFTPVLQVSQTEDKMRDEVGKKDL